MSPDFDKAFWEEHWRPGDGGASMGSNPPHPYLERELARARERAVEAGLDGIEWVEADLETWVPGTAYDLVTTHYAHPAGSQLDLYERLAGWVAPGGTLLVVGHLDADEAGHGHGDGHGPPQGARVTAASVSAGLEGWDVLTAEETTRAAGQGELHDVVVRATRPA